MHDLSKRKAFGSARLKVEHNGNKHELNFVVLDEKVTPLLGLKSSQGMGLIKIMVSDDKNSVNNVAEASKQELVVTADVKNDPELGLFAGVFEGLGRLPGA